MTVTAPKRRVVEKRVLDVLALYGPQSTMQIWHRLGTDWPGSDSKLRSFLTAMENDGLIERQTTRPPVWRIGVGGLVVLGD